MISAISTNYPIAANHRYPNIQQEEISSVRAEVTANGYDHLNIQTVIPIVTIAENGRLEELADETGVNEWRFMKNAGLAVSLEAEKMIGFNKNSKITLLVGKGYNGGNALWSGYLLKQKGYDVEAFLLFPESESPLISQEIMDIFKKNGGSIQPFESSLRPDGNLIIDGILGASFRDSARGVIAEAINWANESNQPILSVDIPSGLNGDTGEAGSVGIHATHTVTFFFPRMGFFIRDGWNLVGALSVVNLGINGNILSQINPEAYLINHDELSKYLESADVIKLNRQKFINLLDHRAEFTIKESQEFSEKHQITLLFTDYPMMLIRPLQKPVIFSEVPLYKFSETDQIHRINNFFEDRFGVSIPVDLSLNSDRS